MPYPVKVGPGVVWFEHGRAVRVEFRVSDGICRYNVGKPDSLRVVRNVGRGTRRLSGLQRRRLMDRAVGYIAAAGAKMKRKRGSR